MPRARVPPDAPPGVGLVETMRAEDGRIPHLDRHGARLGASARAWGLAVDVGALLAQAADAAAQAGAGVHRARLVVAADGRADLDVAPLVSPPFATAWLDPEPLAEAGSWRCTHKTTARAHYDRALARAAAHGADEPLLLNARGEVTEGARTNVWLREGDRWVTPPLAAGGLGGVERAAWLEEAHAEEDVVTPQRLAAADALWLSNALRGRMRVRLVR